MFTESSLCSLLTLWIGSCLAVTSGALDYGKPNIIMILADDMGYGDLSSYGHPTQERGPLDDIAARGIRFTQAYSADSVCSPSRAALLTGRLPVRIGAWGEERRVWFPSSSGGLPHSEVTIAEALKEEGYTTGFAGKWHLGTNKDDSNDGHWLPWNQGFDFVGHFVPFTANNWCEETGAEYCVLMYDRDIISQPYQHENLTRDFVDDILGFIRKDSNDPFFFYYASMQPHTPLFTSKEFKGSSKRGPYGDVINEMSWAVDTVVKELDVLEIANNTLVVFMSDHGPHMEKCSEGGDPGIFRGGKTNSFEGGYRVPLIAYWPGTIEPRVSAEVFSSLDLFQIFLQLAGGSLPANITNDGVNGVDVLLGKSPAQRDFILFYNRDILFAVRYGQYKVHFFTQADESRQFFGEVSCRLGRRLDFFNYCNEKDIERECVTAHDPPLIFDLDKDPSESWPLDPAENTDLLHNVQILVQTHEAGLIRADPLMDQFSQNVLQCCDPDTACTCN